MTDSGQDLILQKWGKIKQEKSVANVVDEQGQKVDIKIGSAKGRWFVTNPGIFAKYRHTFEQMHPQFFK